MTGPRRGHCWLGLLLWLGACGGAVPATHYYLLAHAEAPRPAGQLKLVIDELEAEPTYQERRIVYRDSPYRIDFDPYNRWSADPRLLVTAFLRQAYVERGHFAWAGPSSRHEDVPVLSGMLLAFEELTFQPGGPVAHVELVLMLRAREGGPVRWSNAFRRDVRMERAGPEALAKAMSRLLIEIVDETGPELSRVAARVQAEGGGAPSAGEGGPIPPSARGSATRLDEADDLDDRGQQEWKARERERE